jgi:hypothetical protein
MTDSSIEKSPVIENKSAHKPTKSAPLNDVRSDDDLIDIRFLFVEVLKKWWLIFIFMGFGIWNGIQNMHGFSPSYMARMLVMPIEESAGPTSNRVGASAAVVGAIAGINLSAGQSSTKLDRLIQSTKTLELAKVLDRKYNLMHKLYGGGWDEKTQSWKRPVGKEFEWRERVNTYLKLPTWSPPNIESLSGFVSGSFNAVDVEGTPYKSLTFAHGDPEKALYYLKMIYNESNDYIRRQDEEERNNRRSYLEDRLNSTNIKEFRDALVNFLADEARKDMMAQGNLRGVARILDPPYVSSRKTSPSMLVYIGFPVIFSAAISIALILLFVLVRKE